MTHFIQIYRSYKMSLRTGRIYKIICSQSDDVYIGSTFNTLRDRFYSHKGDYTRYLNNNHSEVAIYPYFKQYGIESFKTILIKEYQVVDRNHLKAYEALWISKSKCVNKVCPFQIKKLTKKLSDKRYREANKNKIKRQNTQYYKDHKEDISKNIKLYNKDHEETIKQYKKEYRKNNIDKIDVKVICECGSRYIKRGKSGHINTKKHHKWLVNQDQ